MLRTVMRYAMRCGAVGLVPLLAHSMPIRCQLPMLVGSHGYMPIPACQATPTATTVDRAVARDVQLRQWPWQIRAAVRDRGGARVVGSGVVHHHAADVLEVAVPSGAPAGIFDGVDTLGLKDIGKPDGVSGPRHVATPSMWRSKISRCTRHCGCPTVLTSNSTWTESYVRAQTKKFMREIGDEIGYSTSVSRAAAGLHTPKYVNALDLRLPPRGMVLDTHLPLASDKHSKHAMRHTRMF